MKLKIFTDYQYLPPGSFPVTILQPFWSQNLEKAQIPWYNYIIDYTNISHSLFEITSLEKADFAILPFDWLYVRGSTWKPKINLAAMHLGVKFAQMVKQANKPLIIFFTNDSSHEPLPIKDAFVFRESLLGSRRLPHDFTLNAAHEDLVKHYLGDELPIRQKKKKPVVGFDGCANKVSQTVKLKELVYQTAMFAKGKSYHFPYRGHHIRNEALKYLSNSQEIETNFVIRDNMVFFNEANNIEQKLKFRLEYVQNMVESDYILCCRGRGNFSLRLYEILCCGRIPIFVNTDCVLPYDFTLDWKKYCVWVDIKDLPQIAQKVVEFHNNLSPQEFVDLQYGCRQLWQKWLSTEGFLANFWQHFQIKAGIT